MDQLKKKHNNNHPPPPGRGPDQLGPGGGRGRRAHRAAHPPGQAPPGAGREREADGAKAGRSVVGGVGGD